MRPSTWSPSCTDPGVRDLLEVRCRLQRGITAVSARGFAAEEAVEDFARCAELCRKLGPRPEHLSAMTGVYSFYLLQGDLAAARQMAGDLRSWVEAGHADYRPENALAFGVLSFFEGDYTGAAERLGQAARQFRTLPADAPRGEQNWLLPFDPLVVTHSHLAPVLWITGRPREAHEAGDRAVARAATLPFPEGPFSMAYAKSYLAWMYAVGGHHETAARIAGEVREIGRRTGSSSGRAPARSIWPWPSSGPPGGPTPRRQSRRTPPCGSSSGPASSCPMS